VPEEYHARHMTTNAVAPFEATEVGFSYGARRVLAGLSLRVERGEIFGVLGANGAGETTLMRLLIGLIKPSAGSALVFGEAASTKQAQLGRDPARVAASWLLSGGIKRASAHLRR
jgi:ABC-type Mn2+/Zn2+ transport system ATPase subunit